MKQTNDLYSFIRLIIVLLIVMYFVGLFQDQYCR